MADANSGNTSGDAITAAELAVIATETIGSLTGYTPESATGLQWDGDKWLVTGGLKAGERLIVEGTDKARPGAQVKAVAAGSK